MNTSDFQTGRPVRVLHSVGHLLRGGIEMWLYQALPLQQSSTIEHIILVRTDEEEAFTGAFREKGISVLSCSSYANPIRYAWEFRALVHEHGPFDVLHVHGSSFSGLLTLMLAKRAGIPRAIVHSHNDVRPALETRGFFYKLYTWAVLWMYRRFADFGYAASLRAAESMFGKQWQGDPRWQILYYGLDCSPFERRQVKSMRESLGIANEALVVGHVGRFHEQKNHEFLLRVAESSVALNPKLHYLLIGDGPLREQITAEVNKRQLQKHFTFVPDTMRVSDYMVDVMDCFVFPSRYEGLGIVAVEAQAAGLLCLISDRVPVEAIVDESLVHVLALEQPVSLWASTVLELAQQGSTRCRTEQSVVRNSRFDLSFCNSSMVNRYAELAKR